MDTNRKHIIDDLCSKVRTNNLTEVDEYIPSLNIDVNDQDSDGNTALHYAVKLGHIDMTKLLISHLADPRVVDNEGKKPSDYLEASKSDGETKKELKELLTTQIKELEFMEHDFKSGSDKHTFFGGPSKSKTDDAQTHQEKSTKRAGK